MAFKVLTDERIKGIFQLIKDNFAIKNHKHNNASGSADGFMSSADKTKLDGIADNANNYTHPTYTAAVSGFYKVTVDDTGHVSAIDKVVKKDITDLGIPAQDTMYDLASTTADGLMSKTDKTKLDGLSNYTLPTASGTTKGGVKVGDNLKITEDVLSVPAADNTQAGVVTLSDSTNSQSSQVAASSKAVKLTYDLANAKQSPATTLSGYGIVDAYTKDEVNGMLSSAFHYKGTKAKYSDLPAAASNTIGDVWNITTADKANGIKAGDNVAWTGTEWDVLSGVTDLTGYTQNSDFVEYTSEEIETLWNAIMA